MFVTWGNNQQLLLLSGGGGFPGPELVVNGDFAGGATGWTIDNFSGASTIALGVAHFADAADDGDQLHQDTLIPTAGFGYRVQFDVSIRTAGNIHFSLGGVNGTIRAAVGTFSEDIVALSGNVLTFNGSFTQLDIDNISVKRVS